MSNKKIIIGLTGEIACGKGAIVNYLVKKYNASSYRYSTILRDVLDRVYQDQTRHNIIATSDFLRKNFGEDILSKTLAEDIKKDKNKIIVFDGVRRIPELKYFKNISNFILISVYSDPKIRYERVVERNENQGDDKKTFKQFMLDQKGVSDFEVPETMNQADFKINNNGNLENLYKQVDQIISKIL
ncbi:AAA family ATPase [Patescibacteria group bacterium]|nr:AAA family ATPase [Patescibacteria group bacterium]MBU0879359.1 AAA family ATPase [Patescibacteria group bacterium]MBU0880031.1 AAA family ATPase [Patescibacteria group bacterium]MBU0897541.1 AAA family ATPase [Patescibacteria group bacterium]MBU1783216.1 AAA family ATPase [Patescibacteria group bacterium]